MIQVKVHSLTSYRSGGSEVQEMDGVAKCVFNPNIPFAIFSSFLTFWLPMTCMILVYYRVYRLLKRFFLFHYILPSREAVKQKKAMSMTTNVQLAPTNGHFRWELVDRFIKTYFHSSLPQLATKRANNAREEGGGELLPRSANSASRGLGQQKSERVAELRSRSARSDEPWHDHRGREDARQKFSFCHLGGEHSWRWEMPSILKAILCPQW